MTDTCCYTYGGYNSSISAGRSGGCTQPRLLKFVVGPKKCNTGCTYIATNMGNVGAMENSDDPSFNNYSANKEYVDQGARGVLVVKEVQADFIPTIKMMFEKGRNYHLAAEYDYQATVEGNYTLSVTVVGLSGSPESVTIKTLIAVDDQVIVNAIVTGDGKEHDVNITTANSAATAVTDRVVKVKIYDVGNTKLV